jgi:hypothetical protein
MSIGNKVQNEKAEDTIEATGFKGKSANISHAEVDVGVTIMLRCVLNEAAEKSIPRMRRLLARLANVNVRLPVPHPASRFSHHS